MRRFATSISARDLVEYLQGQSMLTDLARSRIEDFIREDAMESELPLYLRFLVGVGAFIASLFFLGFLSVSGLVDFRSEGAMLVWGIIFCAGAIGLANLKAGGESNILHTFVMQCSFVCMGIGKILFVAAFAQFCRPHDEWGVFLATLIISAATYHIYRLSIDRFLSTYAVFSSLFFNLVWERSLVGANLILLNLFLVGLISLAAAIFTSSRLSRSYTPLGYSVVCALGTAILSLSYWRELGQWDQRWVFNLAFLNIYMSAALLALIGWVAGDYRKLLHEPLSVAAMGALSLGLISAPGVIFAISLLVLGHARHERLLVVIGMISMPVFLILFYYNLNTDLMSKSIILTGTGFMLLAGRFYISKRVTVKEMHI
jgi:uncharacterized membrane protein